MPVCCALFFTHSRVVQKGTAYGLELFRGADDSGAITVTLLRFDNMVVFFWQGIAIQLVWVKSVNW